MRIAIVGAGFCGLATAWHLLQHADIHVALFDEKGIGQGASGVAAGLLHGFAGAHAKHNWLANEALAATKKLLEVSSKALNQPVFRETGLFRPAITPEQLNDFRVCSAFFPHQTSWKNEKECHDLVKSIQPISGLYIKDCLVVESRLYLQGLYEACLQRGLSFEQAKISSTNELNGFDYIIFTVGAATTTLPELTHLPLKQIKGQILEFQWPEFLRPLPCPINSQAYLLMNKSNTTCIGGATFERQFSHSEADIKYALNEILPKINAFLPQLSSKDCIGCRAGLRSAAPDHRPLLAQISKKCWVLSGMGAKGLLYHALFAEKLVTQMLSTRA